MSNNNNYNHNAADNNNNNNFILLIKDNNRECSMKTYYYSLIILSIIEITIELTILRYMLLKIKYGKIIFGLIVSHSIIYLIFSIYFFIKFKINKNTQKEIVAKTNINQINKYKKITKFLIILGLCATTIYYIYILALICLNDYISPTCDQLDNKNHFDNILKLKTCQYNKCFNLKSVYNNKDSKDRDQYKFNYLCNLRLSNYLINNNDNNKIECVNLPKEKNNNIYTPYNFLNVFYNEKKYNIPNIIYYFLISCDYDFNKYLYICDSLNELNISNYNVSNFSIIDNYNEYNNILNNSTKKVNNDKNRDCVTLSFFITFVFFNLITFFTLPIKVDIWYNENNRFEIIKKKIHPNRLRVNLNNENNNYDNVSVSTDNSSEKSSDSNISENSQGDNNNIFGVVIQN